MIFFFSYFCFYFFSIFLRVFFRFQCTTQNSIYLDQFFTLPKFTTQQALRVQKFKTIETKQTPKMYMVLSSGQQKRRQRTLQHLFALCRKIGGLLIARQRTRQNWMEKMFVGSIERRERYAHISRFVSRRSVVRSSSLLWMCPQNEQTKWNYDERESKKKSEMFGCSGSWYICEHEYGPHIQR